MRTYSPSQKQKRKKRSDCLVFKVCVCVCVARVNFLKKVKPFVLFQTKGAERAGDIFFPCALLKSDEAKKKFHLPLKKAGEQHKEKENQQHFRLIFSPFI